MEKRRRQKEKKKQFPDAAEDENYGKKLNGVRDIIDAIRIFMFAMLFMFPHTLFFVSFCHKPRPI